MEKHLCVWYQGKYFPWIDLPRKFFLKLGGGAECSRGEAGGWEGDNELGMPLMELVFSTSIREVIFPFLRTCSPRENDSQNISQIKHNNWKKAFWKMFSSIANTPYMKTQIGMARAMKSMVNWLL